jgi:outer membrane protein TolC
MIRSKLSAAVGCVLLFVTAQTSIGADQVEATADARPTIEQLRAQRITTLRQVVQQLRVMYQEGSTDVRALLDAQKTLTAALLDGERSAEKRRELLQQQLKLAEELEQISKQMVEAGRIARVDYLRAKADRLEVQIQLRQAGNRRP